LYCNKRKAVLQAGKSSITRFIKDIPGQPASKLKSWEVVFMVITGELKAALFLRWLFCLYYFQLNTKPDRSIPFTPTNLTYTSKKIYPNSISTTLHYKNNAGNNALRP
jgi:hypothetical protein